jgi:UDP-N-acetylglucosamine 1-carboxyvinyltransferase
MALIASRASGTSIIREEMFENRLNYLETLAKMGLKYEKVGEREARIIGPCDLSSSRVSSPDLRAGITILIAAIMARGRSVIEGAEVIDRGYEDIEGKLKGLGARITRSDG